MLQQEKKNNCGALIAWVIIILFVAFAFPPILIFLIILLFTWKISIKKIINYLSKTCFWDNEYLKKDYEKIVDAFKLKQTNTTKIPSHIYRKPEVKKEQKIQENTSYKKVEYKPKKANYKLEQKHYNSWLVIWWQKQKSIWDDYESVLDKFKK